MLLQFLRREIHTDITTHGQKIGGHHFFSSTAGRLVSFKSAAQFFEEMVSQNQRILRKRQGSIWCQQAKGSYLDDYPEAMEKTIFNLVVVIFLLSLIISVLKEGKGVLKTF